MTDAERDGLTEAAMLIVAASVARHGGDRAAELREIMHEAAREGCRQAAAAFARSARDWGDGLDGADNGDRHHTRRFADLWAEKAATSPVDGDGISRLSPGETGLLEAALSVAGRAWTETVRDAAAAARAASDEMASRRVNGTHYLHRLADRWSTFAAPDASWRPM